MSESIVDDVRNHLEFLGFVAKEGEGFVSFRQPRHYTWTVREMGGGVLFGSSFRSTEAGKSNPSALVEVANRINREAIILRAYCDSDADLAFDAWHPNFYEKSTFGAFFSRMAKELEVQLGRQEEAIRELVV